MDSLFSSVKNAASSVTNAASSVTSAVASGVSGVGDSFGSTFTTMTVLNAETKAKILGLSPLTLAKVGRIIKNLQASPHKFTNDEIDLIIKTLYVNQSDENVQASFSMFDLKLNGKNDGSLKGSDFREILTTLGDDISAEKIDDLFKQVDTDGSGNVELAQFKTLFLAMNPPSESVVSSVPGASFMFGGLSSLTSGLGNNFKTLAVLRAPTKAKLLAGSPLLMSKVGRIISALQESEYKFTDDEIDDVIRAFFVSKSDEDYQLVFKLFDSRLNGSEKQSLPATKFKQLYLVFVEEIPDEKLNQLLPQDEDLDFEKFKASLVEIK
eukprot:c18683_g4_i1.p1 GENE.c18683_g4_i1~~c18683_g4_i1.p1  ORF type:complete len:324 (+),score=111.41 c18683_g4_i1:319-1290(+)